MALFKSNTSTNSKPRLQIPLTLVLVLLLSTGLILSHFVTMTIQKNTYSQIFQDAVRKEVQAVIRSQFDTTVYPKWQEVIDLGEKLISNTRVRGGTIYNNIGEELGHFGMKPALSLSAVKSEGSIFLKNDPTKMLDIYYTGEDLGLSEHVIFRVDIREMSGIVQKNLDIELNHFFYKSGVTIILCVGVFFFLLIMPMGKIARVMKQLTECPEKADHFLLNWKRTDSVGQIAKNFDILAERISYLYEEELAAAEQTLTKASQAVLQFNPEGELLAANPSAFTLFEAEVPDDFQNIIQTTQVRIHAAGEAGLIPIFDLRTRGDTKAMVSLLTEHGEYRCFMNTMQVMDRDNEMKRFIVVFHNLTKEMAEIDRLQQEAKSRIAEAMVSERRRVEAKFLLESCFLIIAQYQPPSAEDELVDVSLLPDRLLNKWYDEAHSAGLIAGRLEHDILPLVRGDPEMIEAVMRQSLCLIYSRSVYESPVLKMKAALTKDMEVVFTVIEDNPDPRHMEKRPDTMPHAGKALASVGLNIAIKKAKGRLWELQLDNFDNAVRFSLPSGEKPATVKQLRQDEAA